MRYGDEIWLTCISLCNVSLDIRNHPEKYVCTPLRGVRPPHILIISILEEYGGSHIKVVETKVVDIEKLISGNFNPNSISPKIKKL